MEENKETTTAEAPNFWGDAVSMPHEQETIIEESPVIQNEQVAEVIAPVVEEKAIEKAEPIIQEKVVEVEKVIEKYPEFKDEYTKEVYQAILDGKEDVLKSWFNNHRNEKDVIIKLHTGQGKTLVGLLILQSNLNDNLSKMIR